MMTWLLIVFHIIMVTVVYGTAYRTGYNARIAELRRRDEDGAAPLIETLEKLNLDVNEFIDDKRQDD
ncbi:MAG: hypothetical protein PVF59_02335 [Desulfobacterales bacterium]|jgi:hypothetical protein